MTTKAEILAARLTSVTTRLSLYRAAEASILTGNQSYSIGNRTLTRADLDSISMMIKRLEAQEMQLTQGANIRVQRVVPRDI